MMSVPVLPRQTEKAFMQSVFKLAEMLGWRWYHTFDSRRSAAGFPDAIFLRRPRILWVEFKADRGRVTSAQDAWIKELRACDQEAYIWRPRSWEQIEKLLR